MKIQCVWEHNGDDTILYSDNFIGAFTRGESKKIALRKMPAEVASYLRWKGEPVPDSLEPVITQEKSSGLTISDADSDVLFEEERRPLTISEYQAQKALALKSALDFLTLYKPYRTKRKAACVPEKPSTGRFPEPRPKCMSIRRM